MSTLVHCSLIRRWGCGIVEETPAKTIFIKIKLIAGVSLLLTRLNRPYNVRCSITFRKEEISNDQRSFEETK